MTTKLARPSDRSKGSRKADQHLSIVPDLMIDNNENSGETASLETKMASGAFTLEDFRKQMKMIRQMGSLKDLLKMVPGFSRAMSSIADIDPDADMDRIEALINSMTPDERAAPEKFDHRRRERVARGSGAKVADVERFLADFISMADMSRKMSGFGTMEK